MQGMWQEKSQSQSIRTFLWNAYSQGCSSTECCSVPIFALQLQGSINLWQRLHSTACLMSLQRGEGIFLLPTQKWVYWLYRLSLSSRVLQQQMFLIAAERSTGELIAGTMGSLEKTTEIHSKAYALCGTPATDSHTKQTGERNVKREDESWGRLKKKHLPYPLQQGSQHALPVLTPNSTFTELRATEKQSCAVSPAGCPDISVPRSHAETTATHARTFRAKTLILDT